MFVIHLLMWWTLPSFKSRWIPNSHCNFPEFPRTSIKHAFVIVCWCELALNMSLAIFFCCQTSLTVSVHSVSVDLANTRNTTYIYIYMYVHVVNIVKCLLCDLCWWMRCLRFIVHRQWVLSTGREYCWLQLWWIVETFYILICIYAYLSFCLLTLLWVLRNVCFCSYCFWGYNVRIVY
jgi:hypothetical protein